MSDIFERTIRAEIDQMMRDLNTDDRELARKAYLLGGRTAIALFAWWRDGEQYVGSCGTRLDKGLRYWEQMVCEATHNHGGNDA